jgi:hypothetical protein
MAGISALPAAAAIDSSGPDLSMALAESSSQVAAGGALTYTLTVRNTPVYERVCDLNQHGKPLCTNEEVAGGPVGGVVVQDSLPYGATYVSATGDHGFTCYAFGGVVTCNNGTLSDSDTATLSIAILAPTLARGSANTTLTDAAVVNPSQSINERDYSNNTASITATDVAPH